MTQRCASIEWKTFALRTIVAILSATALGTLVSDTALAQASQPPNIVFILMDNLGYGEVGVYGGGITRGVPPPRIDHLAAEGMQLTNFNVEARCTPP